ncbi:MAG: molybdopterin molybdenumtransferase MoeA [Gammaproteobacteria bacterium]|jgi:molybdopterin molybdotransferase|nr:molybdopterin molybdenumtransferase MoeA [Gammaproteobacteria bacterium]
MITVAEAWQRIDDELPDYGSETVPVEEAAGRVLRADVAAERDQPPFDRVMMDGIALRHTGARRLRVQGTQHAGDAPLELADDAGCIEIMTGAVLPPGADTVVPVERIRSEDGHVELEEGYEPEPGRFIHRRGSDHAAGTRLLEAGCLLGAPEIAVLASQGLASVGVGHRPPVAVISTGNELVPAGAPVAAHEIRQSNGPAILASLLQHGHAGSRHVHLRDEPQVMHERLAALLDAFPVLLLSGGVSKGKADYVPGIMAELGVEVVFHRVSQRPGKPMWFGARGATLVFALPGNPVSALVCFRRYVLPALLRGAGYSGPTAETAMLGADYEFRAPLTCFLPVRAETDAAGSLVAIPAPTNTSGDFTGLAGTTGFVELERERERFAAGTPVTLHRWRLY